jgi:UDP-N-acetylmuramoyl-tripeptide--D-alanyl-D-alanine ligase
MRGEATAERLCAAPMNWTLQNVLAATGGHATTSPAGNPAFGSITTDSRQVEAGALFFALHGPRHDGHDHVAQAFANGAAGAVVDHEPTGVSSRLLLHVADTLRALGDLAAWARRQSSARVVAITGSNGKTTTKEMIAAICTANNASHERVLKTEGNLNNLIGLPLTLFRLRGDETAAVLEMGMNQPGEIARLTEIARPDYAVITNIGPAHLERLGSIAGVAAAKGELFAGLSPEAVIAVNLDDEWVRPIATRFSGRRVTFGNGGEVYARNIVDLTGDGVAFDLVIVARTVKVRLHLVGTHNVSNALAAAAIAHAMGIGPEVIARGLERTVGAAMRMQVKRLANGVTLINDAYNANPSSVEAALVALRRFSGRPVVVLGDMWELGDETRHAHHAVGERAAALGIAELFLLGAQAATTAEGARAAGMRPAAIHVCGSHAEVAEAVVARWQPGDAVLVKGSRGMKMDDVVRLLEGAGSSP